MVQRYNNLTHDLCVKACLMCFDKKWMRNDVMHAINKYAGISRGEFIAQQKTGAVWAKIEAAESIAFEMEQRVLDLIDGDENALDLDPVIFTKRVDGMNGKIRDIAYCCIMHQLLGHLVIAGLQPLLKARILPQQFASIPKRGQTGLAKKVRRNLNSKRLNINHARKADVKSAYGSTSYERIICIIEKEIPAAQWIIILLRALAKMSPSGCLIIGGYMDAWLFNFIMSYALRYVLSLRKVRRGKGVPLIKSAVTFMDDYGLQGSRAADVNTAAKQLVKFLEKEFGLILKIGKATAFLTFEEEVQRKKKASPAARGSPALDMGGYVMHRRYTTIRKAIFVRLRRQYLRAWRDMQKSGTMPLVRAQKVVSYYGYFKQTNSRKAKNNLHADEIHKCAKSIVAFHAREKQRKENGKHERYNRNAKKALQCRN